MLNKLESFLQGAERIVIIGMGNELRADDAIGLELVRLLKSSEGTRLTVFEGHMTPEVFIGPACTVQPTHLLIVDAAELHEKPGAWRLLFQEQLQNGLFTTHAIPATEVVTEIQRRCHVEVAFLGIQPKSREVSLERSKECLKVAQEIVEIIKRIIASSL